MSDEFVENIADIKTTLEDILEEVRKVWVDMPTYKDIEKIGDKLGKGTGGGEKEEGPKKSKATGIFSLFESFGKKLQSLGSNVFGAVGIKLTGLAAGVAGAVVAVAALTAGTIALANHIVEAGRSLAKFSGSLAASYAVSDLKAFFREQRSANNQASSLSSLISSVDRFRDAAQPFFDAAAIAINRILKVLIDAFSGLLEYIGKWININGIIAGLNGIRDELKKKDQPGLLLNRFFEDSVRGNVPVDPAFA